MDVNINENEAREAALEEGPESLVPERMTMKAKRARRRRTRITKARRRLGMAKIFAPDVVDQMSKQPGRLARTGGMKDILASYNPRDFFKGSAGMTRQERRAALPVIDLAEAC